MAALKFADSHHMIAYLEKYIENANFDEIVDFVNTNPIRYALTVCPTVYVPCIEQFWSSAKAKPINEETQIRAKVNGKKIVITESSVWRNLQLNDADDVGEGLGQSIDPQHLSTTTSPSIIEPILFHHHLSLKRLKNIGKPQERPLSYLRLALEITNLKKKVKKLERKNKSRTLQPKRRVNTADVNVVEKEISVVEPVTTASVNVNVASPTTTTTTEKLVVVQEPSEEPRRPTTTPTTELSRKDKGKGIMIDADRQLGEQMQAQEREQLTIKKKSKLLAEFIETKRKYYAAKRVEEKKNKPPTKAQQKSIMCNYLKNVEGHKAKNLKGKSFDVIKKMFDKAYKWVNTFVAMDTNVVESSGKKAESSGNKAYGSKKRAGAELGEESIKRQKLEDDAKKAELSVFGDKSKYPLTQDMHSRMLSGRLQVDYECEMAYELLRFIRIKNLLSALPVTTAGYEDYWCSVKLLLLMKTEKNILHEEDNMIAANKKKRGRSVVVKEEEDGFETRRWSSRSKARPNYADDPFKPIIFDHKINPNKKHKKNPSSSSSSAKKDTPKTSTDDGPSCPKKDTPSTNDVKQLSTSKVVRDGALTRPRYAAKHQVPDENGNLVYVESVMCHQCQRNDKGDVVHCTECKTKRYCYPCMDTWCCPVCQDNCNCKGCLRDMLPKRLNEEHIKEKQIEAKIQGCSLSKLQVKETKCSPSERMYCDCCKTSIFDLHRSFPSYPCSKYLFGGPLEDVKRLTRSSASAAPKDKQFFDSMSAADPLPKELETHDEPMGGCGNGILELIHAKEQEHVSELLASPQELLEKHRPDEDMRDLPKELCTCSYFVCESDDKQMRKAASRQPVIVSNVLETTLGLSWEPMVMWCAFCQIVNVNHNTLLDVSTLNCLDWCEVDINVHQFFKWYTDGRYEDNGWLRILKLKDWPPSSLFEERLPHLFMSNLNSHSNKWPRLYKSTYGLPNKWYQSKDWGTLRREQQLEFIQRQLKRDNQEQIGSCMRKISEECKSMLKNKMKEVMQYNSSLKQPTSNDRYRNYKCFQCKQLGHIVKYCPMDYKVENIDARKETKRRMEGIKAIKPTVLITYPETIHFSTTCMIKDTDLTSWDEIWYVSNQIDRHVCYKLDAFCTIKEGFSITKLEKQKKFLFTYGMGEVLIEEGSKGLIVPGVFYAPEDRMRKMQNQYLQDYFESITKKEEGMEQDLVRIKENLGGYLSVHFSQEFDIVGEIMGLSKRKGEEIRRCYMNYLEVFTLHFKTIRTPRQGHNDVLVESAWKAEKDRECLGSHQWEIGEDGAQRTRPAVLKGKKIMEHLDVQLEDTTKSPEELTQSHYMEDQNLQKMYTDPSSSRIKEEYGSSTSRTSDDFTVIT
nr:hypothetical protein [Tanacetum cinerariifolium]